MGIDAKLLMNIAMMQKAIDGTDLQSINEYDLFNRYWVDINEVQTLLYIRQDSAFSLAFKTLNKI